MKTIFCVLILMLFSSTSFAEGIWNVNGYQLSNVNILDRSNKIEVKGRIQNGPSAQFLKIRILLSNDNGYRRWAETSVQHYVGKGELFEATFRYHQKAKFWNIEQIEVTGNNISNTSQNQNKYFEEKKQPGQIEIMFNNKIIKNDNRKTKFIPKTEVFSENFSRVLFTTFQYISILVKDKKTGKTVFLKSIAPHNLEYTIMEKGHYIAKVQGKHGSSEKEFIIKEDSELIDLN